MLSTELLFKGIFLGFSLAAPVGPIGLLCIQHTLNEGRLAGFVSGLGATVADMIYGCIAGIGATNTNGNYFAVAALVLGISLGSALWWLMLCGGVSLFRAKLTPQRMRWINRIAGIVIVGLGVMALWSLKR